MLKNCIFLTVLLLSLFQIEGFLTVDHFNDDANKEQFYREALDTVNYIRKLHGAKPFAIGSGRKILQWQTSLSSWKRRKGSFFSWEDKDIIDLAKQLCEAVVETLNKDAISSNPKGIREALKDQLFFLDDDPSYGHSIAVMEGKHFDKLTSIKGGLAARYWYKTEYPIYDFKKNVFNKQTAHFTQMIWKSTKEFQPWIGFTDQHDLVVVYIYYQFGNYDVNGNVGSHYKENVEGLVDKARTFEMFLNDPKLQLYPFRKNGDPERSWYSYEDYF